MTRRPVPPHAYDDTRRTRGSGPVLAVLTDSPTDLLVAAHAADIAARTGTLLIAAATVHTTGCSVNALLHHARNRRVRFRTVAIVARITPILHATGVAYFRSTLLVPAGTDTRLSLPTDAVSRLVDRFGAVTVVTGQPLHDPTGVLQPTPDRGRPSSVAPTNPGTERHAPI
ncbi:hypothetical protein AB0C12_27455 [Actinoplanes sp. NPDC048967]|uniref:hypothetical protein n=1 Tax=Actinoplanes sp. NPDC048967 TaxID=3155269 RepID=UPI0033E8176B